MGDRETPRMHKYGESKAIRIRMTNERHVTAWAGRTKYRAAWFLLNRVYVNCKIKWWISIKFRVVYDPHTYRTVRWSRLVRQSSYDKKGIPHAYSDYKFVYFPMPQLL